MKKPLFVLLVYNLNIGGIQRVVLNLAIGLQRKGAEVHFILIKGEGELLKDVPNGIKVIDFQLSSHLQLPLKLIGYLRRTRPTAVLSTHPNMNLAVMVSKKISGIKTRVVLSEHNDPLSASKFRKSKKRLSSPPYFRKMIYQWADAIVGISEGVVQGMAKNIGIPRDQITLIYNPIVSERIQILAKEKVSWPDVKGGQLVKLLSIGRLVPQKDFFTLVDAFSILIKRLPAQLVILGDGEQRKQIEADIQQKGLDENVHLLGYVKNPYAYLSSADIFVSSSLWEGLSTAQVEALACGCQIVSTDCPSGPAEVLEGGKYGRLVPVRNPEALANAIEETIKNPIPKPILRERAEYFSVERSVDQYWQVLTGET